MHTTASEAVKQAAKVKHFWTMLSAPFMAFLLKTLNVGVQPVDDYIVEGKVVTYRRSCIAMSFVAF